MLNGSSNSESSVEARGRPSDASILPSFDGNDSMIPKSGSELAEEDNLMVHVHDLPNAASPDQSLLEQDKRALYRGGPTPYNTPTGPYSARKDMDASIRSNSHASGALVAPPSHMPQVPLAEDYVEEDEGGLIASAVEILNTARDLFGAIIGSSRQTGRSWYD